MSEAVKESVVGVLDGITEKPSGWTEISVRVEGWQYPVKMATKLQPLIELARAAGSEQMQWTYKQQESEKLNPQSGKPFVNRYFEGVEPAGSVPASEQEPSHSPVGKAGSDGMTPEKWDAKERRDYRSRAWAQTLAAFQHTIKVDEDPVAVFDRLQPFQRKVYVDVTGLFAFPEGEEDIPF